MKTIKQITIVLTLIVLTSFNALAQNTPKTNLWKIEGDSIKTSYLFGTLHIVPKKDFVIPEKLQNAFDATEKVVLELDMDDPNFAADAVKSSMLEKDEELKSFMTDEEYNILNTYLKENKGMSLEVFNKFKPIALMSLFMITGYEDQPLESYEMSLIKMAKAVNKEVLGLETFADQVKAFDTESYDEQIDNIVEMVEDVEASEAEYDKMLRLYLAEDVDGMYGYMDEYMDGNTEAIKSLLDDRNNNWIPKITSYSKDNAVLYAVGAGHLGGDQGVINLLRQAGYTVTPVLD